MYNVVSYGNFVTFNFKDEWRIKMAKNKWISFLLCLFLGILGIHKFYEGKVLFGILYILTGGIFGIGVIVDLIILLFKPNPYYV